MFEPVMTVIRRQAAMLLLAGALVGATPPVALALSDWWTPPNVACPTFDSEEACQSYCRADPKRCGGATDCTWKTGDKRPEC
jgi:hypothetical protein